MPSPFPVLGLYWCKWLYCFLLSILLCLHHFLCLVFIGANGCIVSYCSFFYAFTISCARSFLVRMAVLFLTVRSFMPSPFPVLGLYWCKWLYCFLLSVLLCLHHFLFLVFIGANGCIVSYCPFFYAFTISCAWSILVQMAVLFLTVHSFMPSPFPVLGLYWCKWLYCFLLSILLCLHHFLCLVFIGANGCIVSYCPFFYAFTISCSWSLLVQMAVLFLTVHSFMP